MSSLGWLGWTRMPSTPRWPMVLRQRVTTRILLAASTRSLLPISLATAAASSGIKPGRMAASMLSVVASSRIQSRNSPTVRPRNGAKAWRSSDSSIKPADLIGVGIDQRMFDDLLERQVSKDQLGGDAFALGARGQARELVSRLLFVGFGENLAQIAEMKSLVSDDSGQVHGSAPGTAIKIEGR